MAVTSIVQGAPGQRFLSFSNRYVQGARMPPSCVRKPEICEALLFLKSNEYQVGNEEVVNQA